MADREWQCNNCGYWRTATESPNADSGECRWRPPVVVALPSGPVERYPRTRSEDWCGQWVGRLAPDA